MRLFCFGLGYSAEALARRLSARTGALAGTRTSVGAEPAPLGAKLAPFKGDVASAEVRTLLAGATHVLVSIPPDLEGDVVLRLFRDALAAMPELAWVGYLSTVGVYGDAGGAWVDETSPLRPTSERSLRRVQAERAWLAFGKATGRRVEIFRLAGIYGPGPQHRRYAARGDGAAHRQAGPGVQPHPRRRRRPRARRRHRSAHAPSRL